jgi:predicted transposase/invertase (TIGR01784 family)
MQLGIDPTVDCVFKRLFGSEGNAVLLVSLLNAVARPVKPVSGVEMVLPAAEKGSLEDKSVIADIKARDQGKRQFHLEMQWQVPWFFPKRVLYYWGKFHPQQLHQGESYATLRPTVSVCFTKHALYPELSDHHLVFGLREAKHGLTFTDDLEVHLIELPKFQKTAEQIVAALDRWCYFLVHGAELDPERLPAGLDVPEIRSALEVSTVFSQDERDREAYELRLKYELDQLSLHQFLRETEERAGKAEERAGKAEKQGLIGQVHLCQELLKQPRTAEAELDALPREDLAALLAQLREQLLPNGG